MLKNILITGLLVFNFIFCNKIIQTEWGMCTVNNEELSITNIHLIELINNKINSLNMLYGPIPRTQFKILIYTNSSAVIQNNHWDWSLGITYKNNNKIIIKDPAFAHISMARFSQVLEHELNHLMLNQIDLNNSVPRWFKEGFAMLSSNEISMQHKIKTMQLIFNDRLARLNELIVFYNNNQEDFLFNYAQSAIYVETIQKIYGKQIFKLIINDLKNNVNFNQAINNATGNNINTIEKNCIEYINNHYFWLKFINLNDILFSLMPLLLVFGFIIKSYKSKKILQKWKIEEQEIEEHIS